jgi:ribonucleoside-diphosphate reductase alpha chain
LGIRDDIHAIFDTISSMAFIFKSGGGVGINFSPLRENGAKLSGGGTSSGVISFMKIFDHVVDTVKQGGVRRGALMGILNHDHAEVIDFIRVKLQGGLQNFNLSIMVSDEFMKMIETDKKIPLCSPSGQCVESVKAKDIFELICFTAWCNGDPAFLFYDRINKDNPFYPEVKIVACNPCAEVALPDYSACDLGSINLSKFIWKSEFNFDRFEEICKVAMRALSAMNKISTYPMPEIAEAMKKYNPVGVGIMGFADCLIKLGIKYDSKECLEFIDKVGEVYKRSTDEYDPDNFYFYRRIIAPTGSLSILADCSSGIEPVYDTTFERRLTVGVVEETRDFYKSEYVRTAHQVSPEWHVKVLAQWQKWVNGGVSKTVNLPHDASVDDIKTLYKMAWKLGVKGVTVYRDGSRGKDGQVLVSKTNKFSMGKCSDETCTL